MFGISWGIWGLLALVVAVIWSVVWPKNKVQGSQARYLILRWFHGLVWLCLALACFAQASAISESLVGLLRGAALALYLIFIATVLSAKKA